MSDRARPSASVVIRSKNEAVNIEAALGSLCHQTVRSEIILVDSGSTDATVELAKPFCDEIIQIPSETFTFGRALNIGAERASGEVVFALSAHCVATDPEWSAHSLEHYGQPVVAATNGMSFGPLGTPLNGPRPVTFADIHMEPHWGFSNHASSWRRSVWEQIPFDEDVRSCEDKYWMWKVMLAGWVVIADDRLLVASDHRRIAGLRALWAREFSEHRALAELLDYRPNSLGQTAREWWSFFPWPSPRPEWQRRFSPSRTAEIAAGYLGERQGAKERSSITVRLP